VIGFGFREITTAVTKNLVYELLIYQMVLKEKIKLTVVVSYLHLVVAKINFKEIVDSMNSILDFRDFLESSKEIILVITTFKKLD
jgi:hypothetical protein